MILTMETEDIACNFSVVELLSLKIMHCKYRGVIILQKQTCKIRYVICIVSCHLSYDTSIYIY